MLGDVFGNHLADHWRVTANDTLVYVPKQIFERFRGALGDARYYTVQSLH